MPSRWRDQFQFLDSVTSEIDRFRRILNSDLYMPRICKDLAERCEGMLGTRYLHAVHEDISLIVASCVCVCVGHLKENVVYIPEVNVIEKDFHPVVELAKQIAEFLEDVQSLSWIQRRYYKKAELVEKAKSFTLRVDEINCQVIIQLNAYSNQGRDRSRSSLSSDEDDTSEHSRTGRLSRDAKTDAFKNITNDHELLFGTISMVIFVSIAVYIHLYS